MHNMVVTIVSQHSNNWLFITRDKELNFLYVSNYSTDVLSYTYQAQDKAKFPQIMKFGSIRAEFP